MLSKDNLFTVLIQNLMRGQPIVKVNADNRRTHVILEVKIAPTKKGQSSPVFFIFLNWRKSKLHLLCLYAGLFLVAFMSWICSYKVVARCFSSSLLYFGMIFILIVAVSLFFHNTFFFFTIWVMSSIYMQIGDSNGVECT